MNIFGGIILAALVVDFVAGLIADTLNLRALRPEPPAGLVGIYDPEKYRKSQSYTRTKTKFGIVTGSFSLALILAFWFSGGFNDLDQLIRGWGFAPVVNGLFYYAILGLAYELITLPFSIYAIFVIEERYGFNRTTPAVFVMDRLKGLALGLVLGVPLIAGILALFQYAGDFAWLFGWAAVTIYSLVVQFIAPVWLMPLFNKFTPMEEGELRKSIENYAHKVGYEIKNIYVMDGSKRSSKSNAFFTGFGRNRRIALFDTLINNHTIQELVAVLAHEIGHYKKKHIIQGIIISILHSGLVFYLLSVLLNSSGLYDAFYIEQPSVYTGLLFFGMLFAPLEMALSLALNALSRHNEYQADRFAAETTADPAGISDALKKLSADNLSNLTPHPFYVFLNYSHPPLAQRIEAIESVSRAPQS